MKLLTTKQLVRIGRVLCFDWDDDDDKLSEEEKKRIDDIIYPVKQKINKDTLNAAKKASLNKYFTGKIKEHDITIEKIEESYGDGGFSIQPQEFTDFLKTIITIFGPNSRLNWIMVDNKTNFNSLFAHSTFTGNISEWKIKEGANCSYMFAYSEFDTWEHLPKELRDELINPQRGIDTTGIFHGCKGEQKFYQKIEEERKNNPTNH